MKEHESKLLKNKETYKWFNSHLNGVQIYVYDNGIDSVYVDSYNFLHNILGPAIIYKTEVGYWIHGKGYNKQEWEFEVNRILMLEEL